MSYPLPLGLNLTSGIKADTPYRASRTYRFMRPIQIVFTPGSPSLGVRFGRIHTISGVGLVKIGKYGELFTKVITEHQDGLLGKKKRMKLQSKSSCFS